MMNRAQYITAIISIKALKVLRAGLIFQSQCENLEKKKGVGNKI